MPNGFRVFLGGNGQIDPGDSVSVSQTTFTIDTLLGTGSVGYTNGFTTASNTGNFYLATDGNIYSDVSYFLSPPATSSQVNSFTPASNGIVDGTGSADLIDGSFVDIDGDSVTAGDDTIQAGGGNDTIVAGSGDDLIYAGDGDDFIDATATAAGNDSIFGEAGNDTIQHDQETDLVDGGAGDDYIANVDDTAGGQTTAIDGGAGTDTYALDSSEGGSFVSNHIVNLETGEVSFAGNFRDSITGIENVEIIGNSAGVSGDSGDNEITGTGNFANEFVGGAGNDTIDGGAGADDILGDNIILDPTDFADGGGPATVLIVINNSDGPIQLSYIDGSGVLQSFARIEAGQGQGVNTFEGTNWVLRDEEGYYLQLIEGAANQTIYYGSTGLDDTLIGGAGDDTLRGMFGDDQLNGGAGNDLLYGGYGNDTFRLEDVGSDNIFGGAGHDVLDLSGVTTSGVAATFGSIEEIYGSDQAGGDSWSWNYDSVTFHGGINGDDITGGVENDTLHGNGGDDTLTGGHGSDSLTGGAGNDTLTGDGGSLTWTNVGNGATVTGTSGRDIFEWTGGAGHTGDITLDNGSGTDTDGDDFIDAIFVAGTGNGATLTVRGFDLYRDKIKVAEEWTDYSVTYNTDGHHTVTLTYASGNVQTVELYHESGQDFYFGEVFEVGTAPSLAGNDDTLDGGAGNDTLDGGAGADTMTGGTGADVFIVDDGGDTITDFDTFTGIGNANSTDNDFVDLSGFYNATTLADWNTNNPTTQYSNALAWMRADQQDGSLDQAGGLQLQNGGSSVAASSLTAENTGVVCFTNGTAIRTPRGDVLIEDLRVGDLVNTLDNGPQRICWIGYHAVDQTALRAQVKLRPVLIQKGVLGASRPLLVSRQHALLIDRDHLARAAHLTDVPGLRARVANGIRQVTYIHLMFDAHQIIFAEDVPAESFYPGPMALAMMDDPTKHRFAQTFPTLAQPLTKETVAQLYGDSARTFTKHQRIADVLHAPARH